MRYLGRLPQSDPLYGYLRYDMLPQVGVNEGMPDFSVFLMNASNHVYLYHDDNSHARLIGKFFRDDSMRSPEQAFRRMKREFDNLHHARSLGFTGYPHYIARPLGHNAFLNCLLVEECCYGTPLDKIILRAIREGAGEDLYRKLTALAYFLATLHNRTASDGPVDFNQEGAYFDTIVTKLHNWGHLGWEESLEFFWLKDRWREKRRTATSHCL